MTVLYWLIAAAVFLVLEVLTMAYDRLVCGRGSGGSAAGGAQAAVLCRWRPLVVVSVILLMLTRPLAKKYLNSRTVKTNADSLVGRTCIVTQTIDNLRAEGQVSIMGRSGPPGVCGRTRESRRIPG